MYTAQKLLFSCSTLNKRRYYQMWNSLKTHREKSPYGRFNSNYIFQNIYYEKDKNEVGLSTSFQHAIPDDQSQFQPTHQRIPSSLIQLLRP